MMTSKLLASFISVIIQNNRLKVVLYFSIDNSEMLTYTMSVYLINEDEVL